MARGRIHAPMPLHSSQAMIFQCLNWIEVERKRCRKMERRWKKKDIPHDENDKIQMNRVNNDDTSNLLSVCFVLFCFTLSCRRRCCSYCFLYAFDVLFLVDRFRSVGYYSHRYDMRMYIQYDCRNICWLVRCVDVACSSIQLISIQIYMSTHTHPRTNFFTRQSKMK